MTENVISLAEHRRQRGCVDNAIDSIPLPTGYVLTPADRAKLRRIMRFDAAGFLIVDSNIENALWRHFHRPPGPPSAVDAFWAGVVAEAEQRNAERSA